MLEDIKTLIPKSVPVEDEVVKQTAITVRKSDNLLSCMWLVRWFDDTVA